MQLIGPFFVLLQAVWGLIASLYSNQSSEPTLKIELSIMKKLFIALFVLGIALPSFAGIKVKDVVGTWSYEFVTDYETVTGTMEFEKSGKELTGTIFTDDGQPIPFTKVEIRDNNVLYTELEIDYAPYEVSITIEGKKYKGTISTGGGEVPISGAKTESRSLIPLANPARAFPAACGGVSERDSGSVNTAFFTILSILPGAELDLTAG